MINFKALLQEKYIHLAFEISVILKGLNALVEMAGGFALFFVSNGYLYDVIFFLAQKELIEDPNDRIANYLIKSAESLSVSSQHFFAFYLFSHGLIKIGLVAGLLKEKLWAYPVAIMVFGFFIVYQLFRYGATHSTDLLLLTALDALVILLTWHEYRYKQRTLQQG